MNDVAITALLQQLHTALADTTTIGEQDRELLRQLSADITSLLGQSDAAAGPQHESMAARVSEAIRLVEVEHPELTLVLSGVSKALGDMGI